MQDGFLLLNVLEILLLPTVCQNYWTNQTPKDYNNPNNINKGELWVNCLTEVLNQEEH